MNIIIFIVILLVLVLIHEAGHFFSAKKFGIKVDEFGFGFPPKLFSRKYGETEYSFNLLPLGGFVKIFGENPEEENISGPDSARSFTNKPKYQQAIVLFAGIFANFLLAWLLFSVGFISGLPTSLGSEPKGYEVQNVHLVLVSVLEKSPAEIAGLKSGDKIISAKSDNDVADNLTPDTLKSFIVSHPDKKIELDYLRGKDTNIHATEVKAIAVSKGATPTIGIAMDEIGIVKLPIFVALWEGLKLDTNVLSGTISGLYSLVKEALQGQGKMALSGVTGPVGLVGIVGDAYQFGFVYILSLAALISVNLAVINLIPFPALDGGRLLFLLVEKIKGSPINQKFANTANMVGFAILIILMLFITYHDITKLF
jgi:regulator of sigma E protease